MLYVISYAKCNLSEYMEEYQFREFSKGNIMWFLGQLRGLANAIQFIHNISEASKQLQFPSLTSPEQSIRKSAYHHDLKPENILFFQENDSSRGLFKNRRFWIRPSRYSTFGKCNYRVSKRNANVRAPGSVLWRTDFKTLRLMVLGCIFMELLWAFSGHSSVERFAEERFSKDFDVIRTDAYWQTKEGKPSLRLAVVEKLDELEGNVKKQKSQPSDGVVGLIRQMLILDPKKRIIALHLSDTLDRIYLQKKIELTDIDDDSLPKPIDFDRSALLRLSLQSPDCLEPCDIQASDPPLKVP